MPLFELLKAKLEALTGLGKPSPAAARGAVRNREPTPYRLKDDGRIPNNPLPLLIYPGALHLADAADPAAVIEEVFLRHGWGEAWRNGIYPYAHYHSRIHEALGVARGSAGVEFGGPGGIEVSLQAGDVAVLPAGTGHRCLEASRDFLVVGAYPPEGEYDECRGSAEEHARALRTIPQVPVPRADPVAGPYGPLRKLWGKPA